MDSTEVLVVGAGPVGLLTALGLAQQGVSVTVIEAGDDLNDSPRAAVYFSTSLIALRELGLIEDVDAASVRGTRFGFHVPEYGFHAVIPMTSLKRFTFDYQLHCGQDVLSRIVMAHAQRLGVKVLLGYRLTGLEQKGTGVEATVETGAGTRTIRAGWVVGADGARSTVRRLLGLEFAGFSWANRFIATNVYCDFESLGYQHGNFVCDPINCAVIAVLDKQGLWRLTYQEDGDLPRESFMERLPDRYRAFIPDGMKYELAAAGPYTLHQRCATSLRVGRVLLAGDAAHATNPCGGLGLTTGFWTAMILSDVLAAVIRGEEDETILDRYSDERRRIFLEVTSPAATRNKQMLEQKDPEQRRRDIAEVQRILDDEEVALGMMAFPFKVIGDPLREGSRWANADASRGAGLDLAERKEQMV
jgi:2-polyprenyl-6-methoxyphenol hydroxylase-like FAD-dependent oxidoreductase